MRWFESTIAYLFPSVLIDGTPWKPLWEEKERAVFTVIAKVWFAAASVAYLAHYFFFDKALGLEPLEMWWRFRVTMAGLLGATFVFYFTPLQKGRFYKLPALLGLWVMCFTQARVTVWYSVEAWMFCFIFVIASIMILRTTALKSVIFACAAMASQVPSLLEAGLPPMFIASAAVVTLVLTIAFRSGYLSDVRNFILNQEHAEAQKKIIELNIEFSDRIRAFIPKVIADRLERYVNQNRMTVLQASVEVLRPRKRNVACLFSDIRGFTQGSKELDRFINESVVPEMKTCSDAVERYQGIPRKVGDLIFAYFDDDSLNLNLVRSVLAGMEIARTNRDMNATLSQVDIRRYILISSGEAIVGNIGGLDSSIEITALGSPVNFLSRLDELTKTPSVAEFLEPGDLIVCEQSNLRLRKMGLEFEGDTIDLRQAKATIRDFPEVDAVHTIKPTDVNYGRLLEAYQQLRVCDGSNREAGEFWIAESI